MSISRALGLAATQGGAPPVSGEGKGKAKAVASAAGPSVRRCLMMEHRRAERGSGSGSGSSGMWGLDGGEEGSPKRPRQDVSGRDDGGSSSSDVAGKAVAPSWPPRAAAPASTVEWARSTLERTVFLMGKTAEKQWELSLLDRYEEAVGAAPVVPVAAGAGVVVDTTLRLAPPGIGADDDVDTPPVQAPAPPPPAARAFLPAFVSYGCKSSLGGRPATEEEEEETVTIVSPFLAPPAGVHECACSHGARRWTEGFFGVYDGHGGATVAEACRHRMHVVLAEEAARLNLSSGSWSGGAADAALWRDALRASFARVDKEAVAEEEARDPAENARRARARRTVGSTATVVLVLPRLVVVGNCGASRAVLCRGGVAVPLSIDHKPESDYEWSRVQELGGRIINWQGWRVMGMLATSRSIGDYYLKPFVSAEPDVTVVERTEEDEFIIMGSDALWNALSSQAACNLVRHCLSLHVARGPGYARVAAEGAARLLMKVVQNRRGEDDVSVVVVELQRSWMERLAAAVNNNAAP